MEEQQGQPEVVEQGQPAPEVVQESAPATTESEKVDWWDPKKLKTLPDEALIEEGKKYQSEYNKKAEKAKRAEELERKVQELEQREKAIIEDVRATLADENRYRDYQKRYGFAPTPKAEETVPKGPPQFKLGQPQTVEDLERAIATNISERDKYWENLVNKKVAEVRMAAESQIRTVAQPVTEERWQNAIDSMKSEFGDSFAAVEPQVIQKIVNGPYRNMYGQVKEKDLLKKAFFAEFPEQVVAHYNRVKTTQAEQRSKGKTESGGKKVPPTIPTGNTNDDILARIAAKHPEYV